MTPLDAAGGGLLPRGRTQHSPSPPGAVLHDARSQFPVTPPAGVTGSGHPLTAVSLFAGIGGIDLALRRAGIRVVAAVEIDRDCRGILPRHFPEATLFDDVTEVTGDQLLAAGFVPGRGILAAGWPCQGNSVAGRRGGMGDPRSGLWRHVVRLLAETRPAWFLGENVPGLLSVNGGADIAIVRRDLAQLGYWHAERILDAQHFGVPQRRSRLFFVGCPGNGTAPVQVLLEPESGAGHPAPGRAAWSHAAAGASGSAGDARTVGTLGTTSPGGGWRVGADEAAAGQLVTAFNVTPQGHRAPGGWGGFNDAGISASETDQSATLDGAGGSTRIVGAVPLLEIRGRRGPANDSARSGTGIGKSGDPMYTLQAEHQHGIAVEAVATLQGGGHRGHRIDAEGAAGGHLVMHAPDTAYALTSRASRASRASREETYITSAAITAHHGKGPDSDATNGLIIAPPVATTLTSGRSASPGVNPPGCRGEDDFNLVATPLALRGRGDGSNVELGTDGDPAFALRTPGGGSSYPMVAHTLRSEGADASEDGTGRGTPLVPYASVPMGVSENQRGEVLETPYLRQLTTGGGKPGQGYPDGRVALAGLQQMAVRRLTPLECERLQGLPDDWTRWKADGTEQSDSARYRQIGNSVAVPVVEWIARRLVAVNTPSAERGEGVA